MKIYQDLLQDILENGVARPDRTGVGSIFLPGSYLKFDLREGFPAVTTKPLAFKGVVGEMIGFLRGCTSAEDFRNLGCFVWDKNANEDGVRPNQWLVNSNRKGKDDLGRIYGAQWRKWRGQASTVDTQSHLNFATSNHTMDYDVKHIEVDQVWSVLNTLRSNPNDRRMIVNAWRPDEFNQMALPPCHVLHHYLVDSENKILHMNMFQRSVDTILGLPFNIAEYAILLSIVAQLTGYTAGNLGMFLSDVHIYLDHQDAAREQLQRLPYLSPNLVISDIVSPKLLDDMGSAVFDKIQPEYFTLSGYQKHPKLESPTQMHV